LILLITGKDDLSALLKLLTFYIIHNIKNTENIYKYEKYIYYNIESRADA